MKIFSGSANKPLAEQIAKAVGQSVSAIELHVFPDGEQRVKLEESVVGEDVVVVQPTGMPTDNNIMQLLFLIDAAKRSGAKSITAVVSYFGYSRQDHVFRDGEARSLEVVIRAIEQAGATSVISCDVHSIKIPEMFHVPFTHVSALPLFAEEIKKEGWLSEDTFLTTPDMGGIRRIKQLSEMLWDMPYVSIEKNRDLKTGNVAADEIHGEIKGERAIIVDDMISSGNTIAIACDLLTSKGVKDIIVMATHAVFSEHASDILLSSKARKIYVTDTLFVPEQKQIDKLHILSVGQTIADTLRDPLL